LPGLSPPGTARAQAAVDKPARSPLQPPPPFAPLGEAEYEAVAKLAANENPYGPSPSVMQAMNKAFRYANRYGYPDSGLLDDIAKLHGVTKENLLLGAGSGELLGAIGMTFLGHGDKKVIGVEPTYGSVYQWATNIRADAIKVPLLSDYRQDIAGLIKATRQHYRDVGFVYLCNPNNPTGQIITKKEIRRLLDEIPEDVPVLVDEAYHHYVEDEEYGTSIPHVLTGRPVMVTRTFSKIAALAGMRLGYVVAPREIIDRIRTHQSGTLINALSRWGGAAALRDTAGQAQVKKTTIELRNKTTRELQALGYACIPSQTNFFMVHLRRSVVPIIEEFRKKGVLVGRPFPPLLEHLRVSVGTADEMARFVGAFREILVRTAAAPGAAASKEPVGT
jgi:histidinol-phosphate aminotransferase